MILPVTLCTAAAAAVLTMWLMMRIGKMRGQEKIMHGDGGNPALIRRMRAQLNFVESAPFIIALIAAIEIAGKGGQWLPYVAGLFILSRVAHAMGMDAEDVSKLRMVGVMVTMLTLLGLTVVAVLVATGVM